MYDVAQACCYVVQPSAPLLPAVGAGCSPCIVDVIDCLEYAQCLLFSAAVCCSQGVCPTIRYHQYIIASTVCTAHHRALSVFFGRAMPTLADLFSGKPVDDVGAAVYRFVSTPRTQLSAAQHTSCMHPPATSSCMCSRASSVPAV